MSPSSNMNNINYGVKAASDCFVILLQKDFHNCFIQKADFGLNCDDF